MFLVVTGEDELHLKHGLAVLVAIIGNMQTGWEAKRKYSESGFANRKGHEIQPRGPLLPSVDNRAKDSDILTFSCRHSPGSRRRPAHGAALLSTPGSFHRLLGSRR